MSDTSTFLPALLVDREIAASPTRVFEAWTRPEQLMMWWGPAHVSCPEAHLDVRPGGAYAIANLLPEGDVLWIRGTYLVVEPPERLTFTWHVGDHGDDSPEQHVDVRFVAVDGGTRVVVRHERIINPETRASHRGGWIGCLDGLESMLG